jgi:hypothetical protein
MARREVRYDAQAARISSFVSLASESAFFVVASAAWSGLGGGKEGGGGLAA